MIMNLVTYKPKKNTKIIKIDNAHMALLTVLEFPIISLTDLFGVGNRKCIDVESVKS